MILKRSNNLCSTYMLPLVGFNPSSFGIGNFVTSYVNETNEYLVVKIKQINNLIKANQKYRFDFVKDGYTFVVFEIPKQHQEAVRLFKEGKYSQFPEESKQAIRINSRLPYKVMQPNGQHSSAPDLLVLEKHEKVKKLLEQELDEKIDPSAELASIPDDSNFYSLNLSSQLVC